MQDLNPALLEGGKRRRRKSPKNKSRSRRGGNPFIVGGSRRRRVRKSPKSKRGGGFLSALGNAIVPFGLLAAQKRSQKRSHSGRVRKTRRRRGSRRR